MWYSNAIQRWLGLGALASVKQGLQPSKSRQGFSAALVLLLGLFTGQAFAQSTTVSITGSSPATFSRAGQLLTFTVALNTGNSDISTLTFTSGSPTGMSALSCPGLPAALLTTSYCTFTYTTQPMDVVMGKVTALGRWRATRPSGAARSGTTNTLVVAYSPPRQPDAPIIGTATASDSQATVTFAPPAYDGGDPVQGYTVTANPGGESATGTGSPVTVFGLTNGVSYTFTVSATNTLGVSAPSAASNAVTPKASQYILFTNPGTQQFGSSPTLNATTSLGLTVSFASQSPEVCTITSAGRLTFVTAGTCTIQASQPGNDAVAAAASVAHSFAVAPRVPTAPVVGTVTPGDRQVTVAFSPPLSNGGSAITHYTVTSRAGGHSATGTTSPIIVSGLTNGTVYQFSVTATNAAGTSVPSEFSLGAIPNTPAVVTGVSVPANGLYGPGQQLDFTVSWDQPVTIEGSPRLGLVIGSTTVFATYLAPAGSNSHTFRYTVLAGQSDADGIAIGGLDPTDARILNASGMIADLTLRGIASTAGVLVGATNQAPITTVPGGQSVQENGSLLFSSSNGRGIFVNDVDAGSNPVRLTLSATNGQLSLSGTTGLVFLVGSGTNNVTMSFEGTVANLNAALNGLVFRPAPGYFGAASLQVLTSDLGHTGFGGEKTDSDTIAITVVPLDRTPPTVTALTLLDPSPTLATTVRYGVTFSEGVGGVDASDFILSADFDVSGVVVSVNDTSPSTYVVTVQGVTGDGTLRLDLSGTGSEIRDAAGNLAPGHTSSVGYVFDHTAPSVQAVAVPAAGQYVSGQSLNFSVTYTEPVTVIGAPALPIDLNVGGLKHATYLSGSGSNTLTFGYTVQAGDQDLDGIALSSALYLNGATLADTVGNAAGLGLSGVGSTASVLVGPLPQSITGLAANPAAPVYGTNGTFAVSANGGASGNPVIFASTTTGVCTVSGNTVTILAAGACALKANQAGNANYLAAPEATLEVTIGAGTQSISFGAQAAHTFRPGATFEISPLATASSGLNVVYATLSPAVCSISGTTVTILSAGTCSIAADQAGDANYSAAPQVVQDVLIGKASQDITGFATNPPAPVFASNGTFSVFATGGASGNPVVYATTTPAVCAITGNTVTMLGAGTCSVTANQAGNPNYEAAAQATLEVAIGAGTQTISFGAQATQTFSPNGTFAISPLATASSGLAVTYSTLTPTVCALNGTTVTLLAAGTCTIAADQAGDANFQAAAQVTQAVVIDKAPQAITAFAASPAAPMYAPAATFTLSADGGASGNPVVFASTSSGVCSVSGATVTILSAGTCALTANQAGNGNYKAAAQAALDVSIGTGRQNITFGTQPPQSFSPNGTFALNPLASASSGLPVTYSTNTETVCTVSGATVTVLAAGTCTIAADQAGDANYAAAAPVTQSIVIGKATQSISGFAANPSTPVYVPNGTFTVAASGGASGNPVVFATASDTVCSVHGTTVTMLAAGTCAITAHQAGAADYEAAAEVTLVVEIGKASPELSWTGDLSKTYGEADFELPLPTSDSPGAFTFTSSNPQVATVSGRTVTITGAGTATLTATQAATANFAAASMSLVLSVENRPDPTRDAAVAATLQAQVDASVRFAQVQQDNIRSRLGQLRQGQQSASHAVTLNMRGGEGQPGLSLGAADVAGVVPTLPHGWGFWSAGSVILGERDADGARQGFDFRSDGLSVGIDRLLGTHGVVGAAGGLGWNDTDLQDGRSTLDAQHRSLALYGLWRSGSLFVDGILGMGRLEFDIRRWNSVSGGTATAQRDGDQSFGSLTLGYDLQGHNRTLTGYGRLDASRTQLDAYREDGLGIHDLAYGAQDVESSTAAAGLEGRYTVRTDTAVIRPYWTLEWRQSLQNQGDASINYVVLPRASDYLLGLRSYNDDALGMGAGLDMGFDNGWSLGFQVRREQSQDVFANMFGIRVTYGHASRPLLGQYLPQVGEPAWLATQSAQPQH